MTSQRIIALVFIGIALTLAFIFYFGVDFPDDLGGYFKKSYYSQYGPIAISVELMMAGYYLFKGNKKANFALALFGFTASLDIFFHITSILNSSVPLVGMILFALCAIAAFYIAFSNAFNLGKISLWGTLLSFILGNAIEFFFNF